MKNQIKEIIANILYVNSTDEIANNAALFTELGLNSIDYIDLCFELKQQFNKEIEQETLWPINKWLLEKNYYDQNQWTDAGWNKVCQLLKLDSHSKKISVQKLYDFFTVDYLENRLQEMV